MTLISWSRTREAVRSVVPMLVLLVAGGAAAAMWTRLAVSSSSWLELAASQPLTGENSIDPVRVLVAFLVVLCAGRSIVGLTELFIQRVLAGAPSKLRLVCDFVSLRVAADELSKVRASEPRLLAHVGAIGLAAVPSIVVWFRYGPSSVAAAAALATLAIFALELSPFSKSCATEWLRSLYNFMDRKSEAGGKPIEDRIWKIQLFAALVWLAIVVGGIAIAYAPNVARAFRMLELASIQAKLATLGLGALHVVLVVSIIDDFVTGVSGLWGIDRRRTRRIWKRKGRSWPVDEALAGGDVLQTESLERLPLLRQVDEATRAQLLEHARVREIAEGRRACRQGERDRSIFVLLSGQMAIAKVTGRNQRRKVVALLEAGSVFGEAAFFFGTPRSADVVALESSRVLEIRHSDSMKTIDPSKSEELQLRIWFMQALVSNSFLAGLPSEALDALVMAGERKSFKAGEKVISEGEKADACYFLVQGQASVVQNFKPINRLKTGDVFGEIALFDALALRTATVVADADLLTVRLEASRFWALLGAHLPLALEIERIAVARLNADRERGH